ncbi:MAG: DNA primase [Methanobacterium sp.]|nr:MAG: DNA primase [Methanobacterium sp.]
MFEAASLEERKRYYREEWKVDDLPEFITDELNKREFGFDHLGKGPNDRYKIFKNTDQLRKFLRYRSPFAAYCSVAFYNKPWKRGDWQKSELVFDVDAKDLPVRSCNCEGVCEICLNEALLIVKDILDTLKGDLGLKNIHVIYSGRGYHIRVLDPEIMQFDSDVRAQVLKYVSGAENPKNKYFLGPEQGQKPYELEHFTIPLGYPSVFTSRMKYVILHLTGEESIENVNPRLLKDVIKNRHLLEEDQWGLFKNKIGPIRYKKLVEGISKLNMGLIDAKVSIDLKRILRLPSSLHSKVSMRCMEVQNLEKFDPIKKAVPKFVLERKEV